jgi:hypothetical protein
MTHLLVHIPDVFGFDIVCLNCLVEKDEIIVHDWSCESHDATLFELGRPFNLEVGVPFFESHWPGDSKRCSENFGRIGPDSGKAKGHSTLTQHLGGDK